MCIRDRALRAVKAAVSAADIVSGNASLLVGRPRQRDQCFLAGHEMGDLYGIAHSVDTVSYTHLDVYKRQPPALL